jgi:hypothetical protein
MPPHDPWKMTNIAHQQPYAPYRELPGNAKRVMPTTTAFQLAF